MPISLAIVVLQKCLKILLNAVRTTHL